MAFKRKRMGSVAGLALCLACLLLAPACLRVDNRITVEKDGAGTVVLDVRYSRSAVRALGRTAGNLGQSAYPPLSLWGGALQKLFPGPDFTVDFQEMEEGEEYYEEDPEEAAEEDPEAGYTATIAFKDIKALAESPYGRAVSLSAETAGGVFTLRRLHGCEALALFTAHAPELLADPDIKKLFRGKEAEMGELVSRVSITLPAAITRSNGKIEGNTASWTLSSEDLPKKDTGALEPLFASCPAEGLGFTVRPGLIPALQHFRDLEGMHTEAASPPPTKARIRAAARAEAEKLVISGGMDYSGRHLTDIGHGAVLSGAITLPPELAPLRSRPVRLTRVSDDAGDSLLFTPKALRRRSVYRFGGRDEAKGKAERIPFSLRFKAPDWKAEAVGPFDIETGLIYFSGLRAHSLEGIVSAERVKKLSSPETALYRYMGTPSGEGFSNPELAEAGIKVLLDQVGNSGGIYFFPVWTIAAPGAIQDVRLFDANGNPIHALAGIRQSRTGEKDKAAVHWTLIFTGSPPFPWSLALVANDKPVTIPLSLRLPRVSLVSGRKPGKEAP